MNILYINPSDSRCGACGQGANPNEKQHDTVFEYSPNTGRPGCGAKYDAVSSHYVNFEGSYDGIKKMRPDLPFVDPYGRFSEDASAAVV